MFSDAQELISCSPFECLGVLWSKPNWNNTTFHANVALNPFSEASPARISCCSFDTSGIHNLDKPPLDGEDFFSEMQLRASSFRTLCSPFPQCGPSSQLGIESARKTIVWCRQAVRFFDSCALLSDPVCAAQCCNSRHSYGNPEIRNLCTSPTSECAYNLAS